MRGTRNQIGSGVCCTAIENHCQLEHRARISLTSRPLPRDNGAMSESLLRLLFQPTPTRIRGWTRIVRRALPAGWGARGRLLVGVFLAILVAFLVPVAVLVLLVQVMGRFPGNHWIGGLGLLLLAVSQTFAGVFFRRYRKKAGVAIVAHQEVWEELAAEEQARREASRLQETLPGSAPDTAAKTRSRL